MLKVKHFIIGLVSRNDRILIILGRMGYI